ncbi:AAA family ATPase, partial [Listeria monocytogenes]|nr:AAA family ATPase [Listeria monocytogenes]
MNGENIMRKNVLNYLPDLVEASFSGDNNSLESVILSMIRIMAKDSETKGIAEKLSKLLSKHQAGLYLDKNITRAFTIEKESSEIDLYVNRRIPT